MIVMKFGGTSVQDAKAIERAGMIVKGRLEQKPVVVVSAMAKVTDQLLAMARAAANWRSQDRPETLPRICRNATLPTPPENSWGLPCLRNFMATWGPILKR